MSSAPTIPSHHPNPLPICLASGDSASHVVLLLVKKYPKYKIVNLDRLDCKSDSTQRGVDRTSGESVFHDIVIINQR